MIFDQLLFFAAKNSSFFLLVSLVLSVSQSWNSARIGIYNIYYTSHHIFMYEHVTGFLSDASLQAGGELYSVWGSVSASMYPLCSLPGLLQERETRAGLRCYLWKGVCVCVFFKIRQKMFYLCVDLILCKDGWGVKWMQKHLCLPLVVEYKT